MISEKIPIRLNLMECRNKMDPFLLLKMVENTKFPRKISMMRSKYAILFG